MKKHFLLFTLLSLFTFTQIGWGQTTYTSTVSATWSTETWSPPGTPGALDNVIIADGDTVTIDVASITLLNLTVGQGTSGILTFDGVSARAVAVAGNVIVAAGGTLITQTTGTFTNTLSIGGDLTNNGTFDMSQGGTTLVCNVTFNKNGNQTVSGAGGTTRFNQITLNMGTSNANILEISSTNFLAPAAAFVTLTNGTVKMSGSYTFSSLFFTPAAYTIPVNGGIWLNNSNVTVTGQAGSPTNNGLIRITAGTYNGGSGTGNELGNGAASQFVVEGGIYNASGRLKFSTTGGSFKMSNGTINITTSGNASGTTAGFSVAAGANFTWSGGVMNLINKNSAAGGDYSNLCSSPNISGGTLNIGTAATPSGITFSIRGAMPNTILDNTTNNKSATLFGNTNIYGTLTLNGTGLFTVGAFTFTLQNPIAGTPANLTAGTSSSITIAGSGIGINIPSNITALNNLTLNNIGGTTLQGSLALSGTLTLAAGTFTVGPNTLTLQFPIAGTAANLNADNTSSISIGGSGAGINIPTNVTALNNLTINNSSGTTLQAGLLVSGTLTLTSGTITTTAANLLTCTESATVSIGVGTSFVNGPMAYLFATSGSKSRYYPIGKDGIWRPLLFSLTQTTATPSTYTAEMFNSVPATNNMPGTLIWVSGIRYHTISETGGGSAFTAGSVERFYGNDDRVSDVANLRIAQGPAGGGGTWVDLGGTGVGSPNGNITSTVPFTDLTTNTVFVLANATGGLNDLPVELSSFTAASSNSAVVLSWKTAVEIKNYGFDVERSADNKTWTKLTFIQGQGNSNSPKNYSYTDNTVGNAGKYYYRLKQLDNDGVYKYSSVAKVEFVLPEAYSLSQNYPNPFNPSTKINYTLPDDSRVTLDIYNILGVKIGQLVNQDQSAGYYSVNFSSSSLNKNITSGVYLYKITAVDKATGNTFSSIKKMMMLK